MKTDIHDAFAMVLGPRPPYNGPALAAQAVTLARFDGAPATYRAGDFSACFDGISFRPESHALGALQSMAARHETAHKAASALIQSGGDPGVVGAAFDAWAGRHERASLAHIRGHSAIYSPMIAGPSNFPSARMEKRNRAADRRAEHLAAMVPAIVSRMKRLAFPHGAPGEAIRASNPDAPALLADKVAGLEARRDRMKAINALWRKAGRPGRDPADADAWARFAALMIQAGETERTAHALQAGCVNHYMAKHRPQAPFEAFELSNIGARIKQAQTRIAHVSAMPDPDAPVIEQIDTPAGPVRRVENGEAARIQLVFEGKPAAQVRDALKANGFRWAPSEGAWQRHLNNAGRDAARRVIAALQDMA